MLECVSVRWARLLLAVALLGGCSGGRDDDSLPPSVSTSTAPDYSVPAVIDVAYVEKVMEALDHVYGDAIRILAKERQITKEFLEHLAAIYTPKEFEIAQEIWVKDIAAGLVGLLPTPGDPRTTVLRLVRVEPQCVVAAVDRDFTATRDRPVVTTPQHFVGLVPSSDASDLNPTPWRLSFDGFKDDGSEPQEPCA